jgi:ATP-dependent DNA helicase RecQ
MFVGVIELFELLRGLRLEIAREEAVPPYIIFSDKTLIDMCVKLPEDRGTMLDVSGVGSAMLSRSRHRGNLRMTIW